MTSPAPATVVFYSAYLPQFQYFSYGERYNTPEDPTGCAETLGDTSLPALHAAALERIGAWLTRHFLESFAYFRREYADIVAHSVPASDADAKTAPAATPGKRQRLALSAPQDSWYRLCDQLCDPGQKRVRPPRDFEEVARIERELSKENEGGTVTLSPEWTRFTWTVATATLVVERIDRHGHVLPPKTADAESEEEESSSSEGD